MNNESVLVEIGKRISQTRKAQGLTQENLAEQIGLSMQSVSCIELGKKGVRPENLIKICEALEVSADYLLFGKRETAVTDPFFNKLSKLRAEDYRLVETIVDRLQK